MQRLLVASFRFVAAPIIRYRGHLYTICLVSPGAFQPAVVHAQVVTPQTPVAIRTQGALASNEVLVTVCPDLILTNITAALGLLLRYPSSLRYTGPPQYRGGHPKHRHHHEQ